MKKRIAVVAAMFVFAIPAVAGATIVMNRGMYGVSLGNTTQQVRHKLGRPTQIDRSRGITTWFYVNLGLYVDFSGSRVHDLSTIGSSQLTASGVGVGSSETAVERHVPGVHCSPNTQGSKDVECVVASGHIQTEFRVTPQRGRVQSVLITQRP